LTPEIVIERRHSHRPSSGRNRIIRIPLDNRPTLGLRGPPKRVLELERVRCRSRRHRSCYETDYEDPAPPLQPQSNVILANPIPNPCLPLDYSSLIASTGNPAASLGLISNLTEEMIHNLPKQTVHLPPIHLPGSQADANTELHTVLFPAEIINPLDGSLSIIQSNSTANSGGVVNIQSPMSVPAQPQLINVPPNNASLQTFLSTASSPFLQQIQNLMQQVTLSQAQTALPSSNQAPVQSSLPVMPQSNAASISRPNPQTFPRNNTTAGISPSANIRPTNTPNSGSSNPTFSVPSNPGNSTSYRPANITPYRPPNVTTFQPTRTASSNASDLGPYRPANITSYSSMPNRSDRSSMVAPSIPSGSTPYISSSSLGSSDSLGYTPGLGNNSTDVSNPPQSLSRTPYQPNQPMPKSILRNGTYNSQLNTTYNRLNPTSVSSPRGIVRKATTFA
jgi:hypothetical protein